VVAVLVQIKTVPRNSTLYEKQCGVVSALAVTSALPTASVAAGRFIVFVAALYINMLMTSFVARHAAATSWVLVVLAS
jgi:Na+-transporting NADH:ubiquinone oxidoreductase subunit NqrD